MHIMPKEHPKPTEATVKYLYAHAFRCAAADCPRPLYRLNEQSGARTLNSRVCHINARQEGGPRWDPEQSSDVNRSKQNLILMCVEHASAIDDPANLSAYPSELLHSWKATQLQEYDRLKQGWTIDSGMAQDAINLSFSNVGVVINHSTIALAGEGGRAPGAGGGGGGAIGRGARAGRGGDGGNHRLDDGKYAHPWTEAASGRDLPYRRPEGTDADPDPSPGAGGGGAGATGDGTTAGDGGGGGDSISALIDLAPLREAGLANVEVIVGAAGSGGRMPGEHGGNGEDTVVNFVAADGTVLKTLRASGGHGGKSGTSYFPEGTTELSPDDVRGGCRVTTLMPVNAAELRDGALFVLGGGWSRFTVPHIPIEASWPVICTVGWRALEGASPRGLFLSLIHPSGREAACQPLVLSTEAIQHGGCFHWIHQIGAVFDAEGTWVLRVHSGGILLSELDVRVLVAR